VSPSRYIRAVVGALALGACAAPTEENSDVGRTRAALEWNRAGGARPQTTLAQGWFHGCAITAGATLTCWGNNDQGQIGDGSTTARSSPVAVVVPYGVVSVGAGYLHTCAVNNVGQLYCWGWNAYGQLGDGTTTNHPTPTLIPMPAPVVSVALGAAHTCALTVQGNVYCWGMNGNGQLGIGTFTDSLTPVQIGRIVEATSISAKYNHTCITTGPGGVWCWGANGRGQLGNGSTTDSPFPVAATGITDATAVAAGGLHTCALTVGRLAACWGAGDHGQLGDGSTFDVDVPVGTGAVGISVSTGLEHTCLARADGTAQCWGYGAYGQLGNGSNGDASSPTLVTGESDAAVVAAGLYHTCVLGLAGGVTCFGYGVDGELGNGATASSFVPVVAHTAGATPRGATITAGTWTTCALQNDGSARCFGEGPLGDGSSSSSATPVRVVGSAPFVSISAGGWSTCAVVQGGTVECWGSNPHGELGPSVPLGSTSATPVAIPWLTSVVSVSVGSGYACAVLVGGAVGCWGANGSGQLGDTTTTDSSTPVAVSGVSDAVAVSASIGDGYSDAATCALLASHRVMCWGANGAGALGDGTTISRAYAGYVSNLYDATQIAVGQAHVCALRENSNVSCWGSNYYGQLGNGTTSSLPTTLPTSASITGVLAVATGSQFTCATRYLGAVYCWGVNAQGELGMGTTSTYIATPTPIASGPIYAAGIAAGNFHACALSVRGTIFCWGGDSFGETGETTPAYYPTPHAVAGFP
jgi:alpha-tubulin suppressor-like RCC1 family protein